MGGGASLAYQVLRHEAHPNTKLIKSFRDIRVHVLFKVNMVNVTAFVVTPRPVAVINIFTGARAARKAYAISEKTHRTVPQTM